jgi:hypothetical protein
MMIQWYEVVYNNIQWCTIGFGMFPLRGPLYKGFIHIIDFGSPRIDEWMDELHGEEYSMEIEL